MLSGVRLVSGTESIRMNRLGGCFGPEPKVRAEENVLIFFKKILPSGLLVGLKVQKDGFFSNEFSRVYF